MPFVRAALRLTSEEMVVRHPNGFVIVATTVRELTAGSTNEYCVLEEKSEMRTGSLE